MMHTRVVRSAALKYAAVGVGLLLALSQPGVAAQQQAQEEFPRITLTAGRSTVLSTDFDIVRLAVTDPAIADATVVERREVLIDGKASGTVSLILWGANAARRQYDVVVDPGVSVLQQRMRSLFPDEPIEVSANGDAVILSGRVSSTDVSLRAAEIARAVSSKSQVLNLLQVPGGPGSQQVLLQVRFAEVSRRALMEVGVNLFTSPTGIESTLGRVTTGQFPSATFTGLEWEKASNNFGAEVTSASGQFTFTDFLNVFLLSQKYDLGVLIRALRTRGLFQSLAEPNLIAYNGQEASFLAGGEIPVPQVSGNTGNVSIEYKEYGIRLNFRPTVAGDTIRLRVRPEVSTLDFPNGILLGGFRVPALATRRAETEVELRDGQSFAIAGLLSNMSQDDVAELPGLAKLPIIGHLFRSKRQSADQTELMVLITPQLVRPLNPDEVPPLPTLQQRFIRRDEHIGGLLQDGGVADAPDVKATEK